MVIPATLFFIPSDPGTVDPTKYIQSLHDPPLRCDFKQTGLPLVYFKSLTSSLCSGYHNKLTAIAEYEDYAFRNVTSYSLDIYRRTGWRYPLHILCNFKMETCWKRWLIPTRLHGVILQKAAISTVTALKALNIAGPVSYSPLFVGRGTRLNDNTRGVWFPSPPWHGRILPRW
jgi:hypothetical protein